MHKPVLRLMAGGALGAMHGMSALVSAPEVAPEIVGIVIGSMGKGLVAGVLIGWFAKRVNNLAMRIALGLIVGSLTQRYGTRAPVR